MKDTTAGRYINGIRGTGREANVGFCAELLGRHPLHGMYYVHVRVIAANGIRRGEELLVDYTGGSLTDTYWTEELMVYDYLVDEEEMDRRIRDLR